MAEGRSSETDVRDVVRHVGEVVWEKREHKGDTALGGGEHVSKSTEKATNGTGGKHY
jgi:hypothetical protein